MKKMKQKVFLLLIVFIIILSIDGTVIGQDGQLNCKYGANSDSGWCDLNPPINLSQGTCLKLSIGGTAKKVLIRVLEEKNNYSECVGLINNCQGSNIHKVPNNRKIIVRLSSNYSNVKQISVHGGPRAWEFELGRNNGPATLREVKIVNCLPGVCSNKKMVFSILVV